jgi:4-hydroxybenzoate polyprenyltransferase
MTNKISALTYIALGVVSMLLVIYNSHSWPFIISGLTIASISFVFAIFNLVLKEKTNKKFYYLIILSIGMSFLLYGILTK